MRQAFNDLLKHILKRHETLMVYRNARNKYSDKSRDSGTKAGVRGIESSRTVDDGIGAAYRARLCCRGVEREAPQLYVTINPQALKATHTHYLKWIENKAGTTREGSKRRSTRMFGHIGPSLMHEYALKCDFK